MRASFLYLIVVCLTLYSGCTSTGHLTEGGNSVVRYQQFDGSTGEMSLELVLVQETHKDYQNLYSEVRENANFKRCPLPKFSYLVDSLVDLGFMDIAQAGRPLPSSGGGGVTRALVIETGSQRWVAENTELTPEQKQDLREMVSLFQACFNSILGLQVIHSGPGEGGDKIFLEEQKRLREENKTRGR